MEEDHLSHLSLPDLTRITFRTVNNENNLNTPTPIKDEYFTPSTKGGSIPLSNNSPSPKSTP